MSNIVIAGDTSGSVTLQAPAVSGGTVVTLPATTGTAALTSDLIGVGQTWQNVASSRALATNYTNTTGKPIMVVIELGCSATTTQTILVDSVTLSSHAVATSGVAGQMYTFIVPDGSSYQAQNSASGILRWNELR